MSKAARLLDIIQTLRAARTPVRARDLATTLEVDIRTIYRDVATLKARRVPIDGSAGIGYLLRPDYALPPLALTPDELDAVLVGARLVRRTGDAGLRRAAASVVLKINAASPRAGGDSGDSGGASGAFFVSAFGAPEPALFDMTEVRRSIRERKKIRIDYVDQSGVESRRMIQPVGVAYYVEVTLIVAWCELRQEYRHFRTDRIRGITFLSQRFAARADRLPT